MWSYSKEATDLNISVKGGRFIKERLYLTKCRTFTFYIDLTMVYDVRKVKEGIVYGNTVKHVLNGHRIKRPPPIKRTVAEVPKFISLIYFK